MRIGGSFAKATDLKKRIWFVVMALIVYRLGTYVPIPGVDPHVWDSIFKQKGGGLLDMFNMFSGGSLKRMTVFALSIMPYISASIIVQLATALSPKLEALKKEGESGRHKLNQYTRYLTVLLACIQAYGLAVGLEAMQGPEGSAVLNPGLFFRVSTVITIVGWDCVSNVARGTDHLTGDWQWHFADYFLGDCGRFAASVGQYVRTGPSRAILFPWSSFAFGNGCGHCCVYCLHGTGSAANSGSISQTSSRDATNDSSNAKPFAA
jgi:hypothetical protein